MYNFTPVFHSYVKEIIGSAPVKSCELDLIPTSLLNVHIGVLAPIIANIANSSFEVGIFSDELKNVDVGFSSCLFQCSKWFVNNRIKYPVIEKPFTTSNSRMLFCVLFINIPASNSFLVILDQSQIIHTWENS